MPLNRCALGPHSGIGLRRPAMAIGVPTMAWDVLPIATCYSI